MAQDRTIDLTHLGGIKFNESLHRYSNINDITYTGVTTLLHNYYEPFDSERISLNKAIKNVVIREYGEENFIKLKKQVYSEQLKIVKETYRGEEQYQKIKYLIGHDFLYTKLQAFKNKKFTTYENILLEQELLKNEWIETAKVASDEGSKEHDRREQSIIDNKGYEYMGKFFDYLPEKNILNVTLKDRIVIPECLVWNHDLKLGGLADIFLFDKGKILVQDYKTNASIDYKSFNDKKMIGVCSKLLDTNFSHYSLQLRIYQEMALLLRPEFKKGSNTIILTSSERHNRIDDQFIECCKVDTEVKSIFNELKESL